MAANKNGLNGLHFEDVTAKKAAMYQCVILIVVVLSLEASSGLNSSAGGLGHFRIRPQIRANLGHPAEVEGFECKSRKKILHSIITAGSIELKLDSRGEKDNLNVRLGVSAKTKRF